MPFRSEAQRRYMWVRHPEIARRWASSYEFRPRRKVKRKRASKTSDGR